MASMRVSLRNLPGTGAAVGWAGGHTLIVDRPEGRAGGTGLGFNGGQLIALAIGGCLCNDLRYTAEQLQIELSALMVDVEIELDGEPLVIRRADVAVRLQGVDAGADLEGLIRRSAELSTVSNSVARGFPIDIRALPTPAEP